MLRHLLKDFISNKKKCVKDVLKTFKNQNLINKIYK